ncbi:hypothetical protein [Chryseobacterium sp.]|uniref:hypothetical protein n=1 Tax=Chryseobacterium sp. TaxID=1871047 RepID=UPI002FC99276
MDPIIKDHLESIAKHLEGTNYSFLFMMADENLKQDIVKNCSDENAAALMVNYIDKTPEVDTAFSTYVLSMQTPEEQQSFKERLAKKMENRENSIK